MNEDRHARTPIPTPPQQHPQQISVAASQRQGPPQNSAFAAPRLPSRLWVCVETARLSQQQGRGNFYPSRGTRTQ